MEFRMKTILLCLAGFLAGTAPGRTEDRGYGEYTSSLSVEGMVAAATLGLVSPFEDASLVESMVASELLEVVDPTSADPSNMDCAVYTTDYWQWNNCALTCNCTEVFYILGIKFTDVCTRGPFNPHYNSQNPALNVIPGCFHIQGNEGDCYGKLTCDWPSLPPKMGDVPSQTACQATYWNDYIKQRKTIEWTYVWDVKACPSRFNTDPWACQGLKIYDCHCTLNAREKMEKALDDAYRAYRHAYYKNCAPCTPADPSDLLGFLPPICFGPVSGPDCWQEYMNRRAAELEVYAETVNTAEGDCEIIQAAQAKLVSDENASRQKLTDCCNASGV